MRVAKKWCSSVGDSAAGGVQKKRCDVCLALKFVKDFWKGESSICAYVVLDDRRSPRELGVLWHWTMNERQAKRLVLVVPMNDCLISLEY